MAAFPALPQDTVSTTINALCFPSLFLQPSHLFFPNNFCLVRSLQVFIEAMNTFPCSPPPLSSSSPSSCTLSHPFLRCLPAPPVAPPRSRCVVPFAFKREGPYGAGSGEWRVDVDMIVLRKRLHEMRAVESNYQPPAHWMEWEKRYYSSYDAHLCYFVGMLQGFLMNTRPGVALGLLVLVALSVPTSGAVVLFNMVGAVKVVLSCLHLG